MLHENRALVSTIYLFSETRQELQNHLNEFNQMKEGDEKETRRVNLINILANIITYHTQIIREIIKGSTNTNFHAGHRKEDYLDWLRWNRDLYNYQAEQIFLDLDTLCAETIDGFQELITGYKSTLSAIDECFTLPDDHELGRALALAQKRQHDGLKQNLANRFRERIRLRFERRVLANDPIGQEGTAIVLLEEQYQRICELCTGYTALFDEEYKLLLELIRQDTVRKAAAVELMNRANANEHTRKTGTLLQRLKIYLEQRMQTIQSHLSDMIEETTRLGTAVISLVKNPKKGFIGLWYALTHPSDTWEAIKTLVKKHPVRAIGFGLITFGVLAGTIALNVVTLGLAVPIEIAIGISIGASLTLYTTASLIGKPLGDASRAVAVARLQNQAAITDHTENEQRVKTQAQAKIHEMQDRDAFERQLSEERVAFNRRQAAQMQDFLARQREAHEQADQEILESLNGQNPDAIREQVQLFQNRIDEVREEQLALEYNIAAQERELTTAARAFQLMNDAARIFYANANTFFSTRPPIPAVPAQSFDDLAEISSSNTIN